jgi:hypothetical protein
LKSKKKDIDSLLAFLLVKKITTPINNMNAYKLKLIDAQGKILKTPQTEQELEAFTLLDRVVLKIKNLLGSRVVALNSFIYTQTQNNDLYNNLMVLGSVNQRAEIKRLGNTLRQFHESVDIKNDGELVDALLTESFLREFEESI